MTQPLGGYGMRGGTKVTFDPGHGRHPEDHVDVVVPTNFGSHKIRVNGQGNFLDDDPAEGPVFSKKWLRDNG